MCELTEVHAISTSMSRRLKAFTICICIQHLYKDIVRQRNIAESISCAGHFMNGSTPLECWSNFVMMYNLIQFIMHNTPCWVFDFVGLTFCTCACLPKAWSEALCWSNCWWDQWFVVHGKEGWQSAREISQCNLTHICHPSKKAPHKLMLSLFFLGVGT
jgi:hypothetical protein